MKHRGADIRTVNISKDRVVEGIKRYIHSRKLKKEIEKDNNSATIIRAITLVDSYFKLWWKGEPQIVEWRVIEIHNSETRMETRFKLRRGYRLWYWLSLSGFLLLSCLCYQFSFFQLDRARTFLGQSSNLYIATIAIFACVMLVLMSLFFVLHSINPKYEFLISAITNELKKNHVSYFEETLQSNYTYPDLLIVMFFYVFVLVIFMIASGSTRFFLTSHLVFALIALGSLSIFILYGVMYRGYTQRLIFIITAIPMIFPILLIYALPTINTLVAPTPESYYQYLDLGGNEHRSKFQEPLKAIRSRLSFFFATKMLAYLSLVSLPIYLLMTAPKLFLRIKERIKIFYLITPKESDFHKAINPSGFIKKYSLSVLFFWITGSVGIYWVTYTSLSILIFDIFGRALPYSETVARKFCGDVTLGLCLFFDPQLNRSSVTVVAHVMILLYLFPLFLVLLKFGKKRLDGYLYDLAVLRKHSLSEKNYNSCLFRICKEIALNLGVNVPRIILIPSKVPRIFAKYVGFPIFTSCIFVSDACLKMRTTEIEGLLAHEMHHIKGHCFRWYLLNLLSDYTLFGTGFLAVTTNSYLEELRADDFAVDWLRKEKKIPTSDFVNALRIMAVSVSVTEIRGSALGLIAEGEANGKTSSKRKKSLLRKLRKNIGTLFEMYFGDEILSYIHPTLNERISRIEDCACS